jgi:hypothetical protein
VDRVEAAKHDTYRARKGLSYSEIWMPAASKQEYVCGQSGRRYQTSKPRFTSSNYRQTCNV